MVATRVTFLTLGTMALKVSFCHIFILTLSGINISHFSQWYLPSPYIARDSATTTRLMRCFVLVRISAKRCEARVHIHITLDLVHRLTSACLCYQMNDIISITNSALQCISITNVSLDKPCFILYATIQR